MTLVNEYIQTHAAIYKCMLICKYFQLQVAMLSKYLNDLNDTDNSKQASRQAASKHTYACLLNSVHISKLQTYCFQMRTNYTYILASKRTNAISLKAGTAVKGQLLLHCQSKLIFYVY